MKRRVVITGLGALTPIGNNVSDFWKNLLDNHCGIDRIKAFEIDDFPVKLAAEVKEPDFSRISKRDLKFDARFTNFARIASFEAWRDAGLDIQKEDPEKIGVFISTSIGGPETLSNNVRILDRRGATAISPFFVQSVLPNTAAAKVSIDLGSHGSTICHTAACAGGSISIGEAYLKVAGGIQDVILAGASDASITPLTLAGFASMYAIYRGDDKALSSIPFDERRSGFVIGEGAGILILEELEHARQRGAKIYAEIVGYGSNSDAFSIVSPEDEGVHSSGAMLSSIKAAELNPEDIDYVNAHATSTPLGDKTEAKAIRSVFGENLPLISSIKSQIGHLLSASGAVEAIATILALRDGIIPGTITCSELDPDCNIPVVFEHKKKATKYALSNSFGFGGHNSCLVFKKWSEG